MSLALVTREEQNMENNYLELEEITKNTQNWKSKVTVISKLPWRTAENGTRYQRLVLADAMVFTSSTT